MGDLGWATHNTVIGRWSIRPRGRAPCVGGGWGRARRRRLSHRRAPSRHHLSRCTCVGAVDDAVASCSVPTEQDVGGQAVITAQWMLDRGIITPAQFAAAQAAQASSSATPTPQLALPASITSDVDAVGTPRVPPHTLYRSAVSTFSASWKVLTSTVAWHDPQVHHRSLSRSRNVSRNSPSSGCVGGTRWDSTPASSNGSGSSSWRLPKLWC